jgi:uncharacterized protein (DUF58 family)
MAVGPYGALLEAVRGVRWPARRVVAGGAPGVHPARTRGVSSEFVEYRPYRQGDDPRRLDWKLLARSDRAFIRLAPDRAVIGTLIAVDASASMAFPLPGLGKWVAAKRLAVACAAIAHGAGDPVGLALAGAKGVARFAARTRRGVVAEIARTLDSITPAGNTPLADAFVGASSRVLVITDCLGDVAALRRAARAHVAAGGEVHVAHVVAREELEPARAAILATDPEDAAVARPLTTAVHAAYRAVFDEWRAEVSRGWHADGVTYHEVADDEAADVAVRRIVSPPVGTGVRA